MSSWKTISDIRRDYGQLKLNDAEALASPIAQFKRWFEESLATETDDPTAMVCSTVDEKGRPDSRVVLLKEVDGEAFIFYTNYHSAKGQQILHNSNVALNFYWPKLVRQVRVRGHAVQISAEQSDAYFASRPVSSQLSAMVSHQSQVLDDNLEEQLRTRLEQHPFNEPIIRPSHWGGYAVIPEEIEFWQGRDNRLHDRIRYMRTNDHWQHARLAP